LAGDLAIIFTGHAWVPTLPTGWTQNDLSTGSNWNGSAYSKALTSGDISAGSVTVSFSGSFDGALAIISFVGSAGFGVKETDPQRNGSGSASITLSTASPSSGAVADTFIYFGSNRAASTNSVNRGTLQRQANDGSAASGCLYTETGVAGLFSATFSYSVAGSGNYQAIVIVGAPPVPVAAKIVAPVTDAGKGADHQLVKAPAAVTLTAGMLSPSPIAQVIQGGTLNVPYSETITTAGGTAPYTYSVISGSLPTGTSLNSSSGVISGTPTATGTFTFSIKSLDANSYSGTQSFSITISPLQVSNYGYVA